MRKILKNNKRTRRYIESLPKIYIIGYWARWGVMEFPFVKLSKGLVPMVYKYNDYNGTADVYELTPIEWTTTGQIFDWTFSEKKAERIANLLNRE